VGIPGLFSQPMGPIEQRRPIWAVWQDLGPSRCHCRAPNDTRGERNAKEYMRNASLWCPFLPLATAPPSILSILVSSICLSDLGFLRRLVGHGAERRSEASVELTPLSVFPATSVYTSRGVEIDLFYSKGKIAFVCGHIRSANDIVLVVVAFRVLLCRSA
jgi:hypothetical protein